MAERKIFKISDAEIKQMYLDGNSLSDIAQVAQDTKGLMALRQKLHDLGIDTTRNMKKYSLKISKAGKKYTLNEHIFDVIDTEEKAYWLGWYMTDGCNNQKKHNVSIRLQERDEEILIKLQQFLETNAPIYHHHNSIELLICSLIFSNSLAKFGVVQRKTHHKSIPELPQNLIKPFLRGYFDGDGCISITKRNDRKNPNSITVQINFTGNEEPIKYIEDFLRRELNLAPRKLQYKGESCMVHYGGIHVCLKILDWLYKDTTLHLKRKYDKYLQLVSRQSNLQ